MYSLTIAGPHQLELRPAAPLASPPAGMVLVKVRHAGVCGTDYHAIKGAQPFFSFPRVLGHELGVEILEVGAGVLLELGQKCAVEPYLNCGKCPACERGRGNCCESMQVLGVHTDGGMRPHLLVPAEKLHPSSQLTTTQLALVEPLAIGAHAVNRVFESGILPGVHDDGQENVLVIGGGPIGVAVAQSAILQGHNVALLDVNADRLSFVASNLRLCGTVNGTGLTEPGALPKAVAALWSGQLPTVVFDATGNRLSMQAAFQLVGHAGVLCFVGLVNDEISFFDPDFHRRELTVLASRNALPADFRSLIAAMEAGEIGTDFWVTHRAHLSEAPTAMLEWMRPESAVFKGMLNISA